MKILAINNYDLEWAYNEPGKVPMHQSWGVDYMRELGLNVVFAHLGYQKINNLWVEGEEGDSLTERFIQDISICKDNDIDLVIMHLTSKS